MNPTLDLPSTSVTPAEVARRMDEYRRQAFISRAPAQVVYHGADISCPYPGCSLKIVGIHFQLEMLGDAQQASRWLGQWWNGPGLVGQCPHCGNPVLFGVTSKCMASAEDRSNGTCLPADWADKSKVVYQTDS